MRRLHIVLITNVECEEDKAAHMLEKMGHRVWSAFDGEAATVMLQGCPGTGKEWDAVIIDGFSVASAEEVSLEVRMQHEQIYIGIIAEEVKHKGPNAYATEVIPQNFAALKDALGNRFPEVI